MATITDKHNELKLITHKNNIIIIIIIIIIIMIIIIITFCAFIEHANQTLTVLEENVNEPID